MGLSSIVTATVLVVVFVGWAYQAIKPPSPKICGSPGGPPITSPRIQLRDGRHLAYKETGVSKDKATYRIILVHGFDSSKDLTLPISKELVEVLGVYFVAFDRAGYGESDPNPKRDVKSEAFDIEELADQLEIGAKFYLIGVSMGAYPTWSCLKYIPHRLAGAALVAPAINYWWPSFPAYLSKLAFNKLLVQDQRTVWIAHHMPYLLYGWLTQKWLPALSVLQGHPSVFSQQDKEIMQKMAAHNEPTENKARQQGLFESLYQDLIVAYSKWEFDPMNISNPFVRNNGSVHIWQGYDDRLVPVELNHYVAKKLSWIKYHEIPQGHLFFFVNEWSDAILKSLLLTAT